MVVQKLEKEKDLELIRQYCSTGNGQFFTEFFRRHNEIAYRTAYRILGNEADAEDVIQVSFIELVKNSDRLNESSTFPAWLLQIIICRSKDKLRAEKRRKLNESQRMPKQLAKNLKSNNNIELITKLKELLNQLPTKYKDPICLNLLENMSIKEISKTLSKPEKTIRTQINRGLSQLRAAFKLSGFVISSMVLTELFSNKEVNAIELPYQIEQKAHHIDEQIQRDLSDSLSPVFSSAKITLFISSVAVLCLIAFFQFNHLIVNKKGDAAIALKRKYWSFSGTDKLKDLKSIFGKSIKLQNSQGELDSTSLFVSENTMFQIDVRGFKLPIKLTYKRDFAFKTGVKTGGVNAKEAFMTNTVESKHEDKSFSIIYKPNRSNGHVGSYYSKRKGWQKVELYITKNHNIVFLNGKIKFLSQKKNTTPEFIKVFAFKEILIDNLVVEEVNVDDVPPIGYDTNLIVKILPNESVQNKFQLKKYYPKNKDLKDLVVVVESHYTHHFWYNLNEAQYNKMMKVKPN